MYEYSEWRRGGNRTLVTANSEKELKRKVRSKKGYKIISNPPYQEEFNTAWGSRWVCLLERTKKDSSLD